ncbi:MAG: OB-fold nucleic acid binding domain-containing protein [bacterium]
MEKELIGLYISDNPLFYYAEELAKRVSHSIEELEEIDDNSTVMIGGVIASKKLIETKNGKMGFFQVEDLSGNVEVVVYPKLFREIKEEIGNSTNVFIIEGKVDKKEDEIKIIADRISLIGRSIGITNPRCLHISIGEDKCSDNVLFRIKDVISEHKGALPVIIHIIDDTEVYQIALGEEYKVKETGQLVKELQTILGVSNVWIE